MARPETCPTCSSKLARSAAYCATCGKAVGVQLDFADLDEDEEFAREPRIVEPDRPHGLRNLLIGVGVVVGIIGGALLVSREAPRPLAATKPTTTTARPGTTTTPTSTIVTTTTSEYSERPLPPPLIPEPTGAVVYGIDAGGRLVRVDLDGGRVSFRHLDLASDQSPPLLVPRAGGVVMLTSEVVMVPDGPATALTTLGTDFSQVLPAAAADELWEVHQSVESGGAGEWRVHRLRTDGTPTTPEASLPPFLWLMGDGVGGVLMTSVGGTYQVDPQGGSPTRVLDGQAVGASATTLVDLRCDDRLKCRWRVTDRQTGEHHLLAQAPSPADVGRFLYRPGSLSPDGSYLAFYDDQIGLSIVDTGSGGERQVGSSPESFCCPEPAWSPDGRWLFWTNLGKLQAFQAATGQAVEVGAPTLQDLSAIAVGPAPAG